MMRLTRRYRFAASHRLHSAALTEAENYDLYGKCNNPYGHGHNYVLEVAVRPQGEKSTVRLWFVSANRNLNPEDVTYLEKWLKVTKEGGPHSTRSQRDEL